jgi:hypothetical protein
MALASAVSSASATQIFWTGAGANGNWNNTANGDISFLTGSIRNSVNTVNFGSNTSGNMAFTGFLENDRNGASAVTYNVDTVRASFGGGMRSTNNGTGSTAGNLQMFKAGTGTLALTGTANANLNFGISGNPGYGYNYTVSGGTLLVDGTFTNTRKDATHGGATGLTVNSGTTVGGNGTFNLLDTALLATDPTTAQANAKSAVFNGTVAPGDPAVQSVAGNDGTLGLGAITFTGNTMTFGSTGTLALQLDGNDNSTNALYDSMLVNGTATLTAGATIQASLVNSFTLAAGNGAVLAIDDTGLRMEPIPRSPSPPAAMPSVPRSRWPMA